MDRLLTVAEVADLAGVDYSTVRRWIAAGHLDAVKLVGSLRIREADFAAFVESGRRVGDAS